jgi:hypothetical protein
MDAYKKGHFRSIRKAAEAYTIHFSTLAARLGGRVSRVDIHPNRQKLSETEEEVLER